MRQISVTIAAACFIVGTVGFGVFFVQVACIVINMPSLDNFLAQAGPIQKWGWYSFVLYVAGFLILFLTSKPDKRPSDKPGAAPHPPRDVDTG